MGPNRRSKDESGGGAALKSLSFSLTLHWRHQREQVRNLLMPSNLQDVYKHQASVVRHGFHHHPLFFVCPEEGLLKKLRDAALKSNVQAMKAGWWDSMQVVMDVTMVWCPTLEQKLEHGTTCRSSITWGLGLGSRFRGATFPDHSYMSPIRSASWGKKHREDQ